jgi:hypothetical protein
VNVRIKNGPVQAVREKADLLIALDHDTIVRDYDL